jgi:hypothetical protein
MHSFKYLKRKDQMNKSNKPKHTPAPWKIETYCGPLFGIVRDRGIDDVPDYRTEADARLIAASPEMLDLLVQIGTHLKRGDVIDPKRDAIVLSKIKELVSKATGGES